MIKKIPDERGYVAHIMKLTDENYQKLGKIEEIYASCCYPMRIKGWHYHTQMDMVYTCISGMAQVVVSEFVAPIGKNEMGLANRYVKCGDQYIEGPWNHNFTTSFIGDNNYDQVFIPRGKWNAFRAVGNEPCIMINITNMPHDPEEIVRLDNHYLQRQYYWDYHI